MTTAQAQENQLGELPIESAFSPRWLLRNLLRYKWLILGTMLLVPTIATLYAMRLPKVYQATATLQYEPSPPRPLGNEVDDVADPVGSYLTSQEWYRTQNRVIASRAVAERVVRKLALHKDPSFFYVEKEKEFEPREVTKTAQVLQGRLNVDQKKETRLVSVQIKDRDPERAQLIANTVARSYIEKMAEDRMKSTVDALDWLSEQLDSQRKELHSSEFALHEFKKSNDVLSVSLEDRQNMVSRDIERYSEALTQARLQVIDIKAKLEQLRNIDLDDPLTVPDVFAEGDAAVGTLRESYRASLAKRNELAVRYGENHPDLQSLDAKLETLKSQIREEIESAIAGTSSALREAQARESSIREALDKANAAGMDLNRHEIEYRKLQRRANNDEKLYSLLLERTTETNLTRLIQLSKVQLLEPALKPGAPVKPRMSLFVMSGILGGLLLGFGLVFLITRLDTTVKSVADVESAGIPVLGVLPVIDKNERNETEKRRRRRRNKEPKRHKYNPERDLVVYNQPKSAVAECCRTIRTNLTFMSADSSLQTLMVTSASPLEGKTTVAVSIAISLAQSGKNVLLVDTDLRRPRAHRTFGLRSEVGVTSILVGESTLDDAVQDSAVAGLSVLTCGPIPPNPAELLQMGQFQTLLHEAQGKYDRVIFDSPPLGAVIDAAIVGPQVAGTLMVVQAETTAMGAVKSAMRQLQDVNASLIGAVINSVELSSKRYGYGGYYYYRGTGYYSTEETPPPQPAASN